MGQASGGPLPANAFATLSDTGPSYAARLRATIVTAMGVGLPRPFWTPLPVIVTLRPQRREAFLLIVQYLIGSAVAVGLTVGIIVAVSGTLPREGIAVVFAFAAFALQKTNYALFVAMLITMILVLITLLVGGDLSLPELRILETLLGLSIASIVAFVWDDRGGEPLQARASWWVVCQRNCCSWRRCRKRVVARGSSRHSSL